MHYIGCIWRVIIGVFWMAPLIGFLFLPKQTLSLAENRKLAEFPKYTSESLPLYLRGIENYWNDHLGFRDLLVFLNNYVLWAVFDKSSVSWVTIGKDGWLFYAGDQSNEDVIGRVTLKDDELKRWLCVLQAKKEWLERQGVRYFFILVPDKQSIYPEYLPDLLKRYAVSHKRIDALVNNLRKYHVDFLDLRAELLREKEHEQVYFQKDSHWNFQGAYVAYRRIIYELSSWFPEMKPLSKSNLLQLEKDFLEVDLRMGLDGVIREKVVHWIPKEPCSLPIRGDNRNYLFEKRCLNAKRRAIVIRDSCMTLLEPYLSEHFNHVVYIWKRWAEDSGEGHTLLKEWIDRIHPHILIEERVERLIGQIPTATMQQRFDYAHPLLGQWDSNRGFDGIMLHQQALLEPADDGLLIHATGSDPGLRFPDLGQDIGPLILRIEIESPADTVLQVFYTNTAEAGYVEENSRTIPLKKGENAVYLCIEEPTIKGQLRLDPGFAPGTYLLRSVEIRQDRLESLFQAYDVER